jgi:hypothetical protein
MNNPSLDIGALMRSAFERTKDRFAPYFLGSVLVVVIGTIAFLGTFTIGGYLLNLAVSARSLPMLVFFSLLFLVLLSGVFVYLLSWFQLLVVKILTQEEKTGIVETANNIRHDILGFFWFMVLSIIFFTGLLPYGILTLSLVLILWCFWNSFSIFVYLQKRKQGLHNLWYSRSLINQNFWPVAGRIFLVNSVIFALYLVLLNQRTPFTNAGVVLLHFLITPFLVSYNFEIYKNLKEPKKVEKPVSWLILSVFGWILNIIFLFLIISFIGMFFISVQRAPQKNNPPQDSYPLNKNSPVIKSI